MSKRSNNAPKSRSATIKDVAKRAGVSTATVSHALNGTRYVQPDTLQRVVEAAAELGYTGHAIARSLRQGRTRILGLVLSDIENPFFTRLARHIEEVASACGYQVLLANTAERQEREIRVLESLSQQLVAGIILAPTRDSAVSADYLISKNTPIILINRYVAEGQVPYVGTDNKLGGYLAARHLISLGHCVVAVVSGYRTTTMRDRIEGIQAGLRESAVELKESHVVEAGISSEEAYTAALRLLSEPNSPTAILALNSFMAAGVLRALRELGMRCPEDVAVIAFDMGSAAQMQTPPLTTVEQPFKSMAAEAVGRLVSEIEDGKHAGSAILDPHLIIGASCGEGGCSSDEAIKQLVS